LSAPKRESFLGGAFLLALAAFVSRLLGALYRIPLYPILKRDGMGLFQMAYPIYALILTLSTTGINIAISKLVAEREARGDAAGARRVFTTSMWLLGVSGLVFSIGLFFSSGLIADKVAKDPRSFLSIASIAPAVFFVSVMSAYRGYFQGRQSMGPTAYSQIIEQVVRVGTMFLMALWLLPMGIEFAAAGATFGAVTGAFCGLLYLLWVFQSSGGTGKIPDDGRPQEPMGKVMREIVKIAIPISMTTGILSLMSLVDLALVPSRLQAAGLTYIEATGEYGELTGGALPLMNLPTVFTSALQVSLVPAVAQLLALSDLKRIRVRTVTAMRMTFALMLPSVVGLFVLAREIPTFLYRDPGVGPSLAAISWAALFLAVQQTTSGVLQGMGHLNVPVRNLLAGAIVKTIATYILTSIPSLGIIGAAYATVLGFLVSATLNVIALTSRLGEIIDLRDMIIKPVASVVFMGLAVRLSYNALFDLLKSNGYATIGSVTIGGLIYMVLMMASGALKESDMAMVPVIGSRLAGFIKKSGSPKE
jgi:stage V sporulation protein B